MLKHIFKNKTLIKWIVLKLLQLLCQLLFYSPRCVICSGIWTGICKAATELGAGLLVSSTRVSRICSDEEEDGLP